jgi:hypothetical protein
MTGKSSGMRHGVFLDAGLRVKSADRRAEAIAALGVAAGDKRALETLEECLRDPKPELRTAAVARWGYECEVVFAEDQSSS